MRLAPAALVATVAGLVLLGGCADVRSTDATASQCARCHGGQDNLSGAPPFDLQGRDATTLVSVGQHTAHVDAGVACGNCHPERPAVNVPGHPDGKVDVAFQGLAALNSPGPAFDRNAATCSGIYCHGATLNAGGQLTTPTWIQPFAGFRCSQCHAFPPLTTHPQRTDCGTCHTETVGADGTLIAGGKHVNGTVEVTGGHGPGFANPALHGPEAIRHLANQPGALDCRVCHGADFNGGTVAPSCTACHQAAGWTNPAWQSNCTFCHGTRNKAFAFATQLNQSAPPEAVLNGETTGPRVGAHTRHLTAGPRSGAFACATCHLVPDPATSLAHVNGAAAVGFTGPGSIIAALPNAGSFTPGATRDVSGTCATYCHQPVPTQAGALPNPAWAGGALACNACHQNPPNTGKHPGATPGHAFMGTNCSICHVTVAGGTLNITNPALHANAVNNVGTPIAGQPTTFTIPSGTYEASNKTCSTACHGTLAPFPW